MFKVSEHEGGGGGYGSGGSFFPGSTPVGPRISFSHDFADTIHRERGSYKEAPVSPSDFEFSVKNYAMIPADEIFLQGVLVPSRKTTTLRDELLVGDDDEDASGEGGGLSGFRRGSAGRWIERWGLKKSNHHQFGSKKGGRRGGSLDDGLLETVVEEKAFQFIGPEALRAAKGCSIKPCNHAPLSNG